MASKTILFVAQALLIQLTMGQILQPYSSNSFVENSVVLNGVNAGVGLANTANLAGAATLANTANLVGAAGVGLANTANLAGAATLANTASLAGAAALANVANVGLASLATGPEFVNLATLSGGGVLPITSYSPIVPAGLAVVSDNAIEGSLFVNGELPFLSAVAFEGALNTEGAGAASCGCGSGSIGITAENYSPSLGLGGVGGLGGLGYGLGGRGLGLRL